MFNCKGKVALVTDASSGIGKAYTEELASKGRHVILAARSKEKLDILTEKLASTYKIQAVPIMSDLSQFDSVEQLVSKIKDLGLKVLAFCPGPTKTDFFNVSGIEHLPGDAKTP